jgi:hypothetical protein
MTRGWARWKTKEPQALGCGFLVKKGSVNLAQGEGLGAAEILTHRADTDVLLLSFTEVNAEQLRKLKVLLSEQLTGFREVFAKGA